MSNMSSPGQRLFITASQFLARAREGLHSAPADTIFDPRTARAWEPAECRKDPVLAAELASFPPPRPAAVLVPVVKRSELTVLLTVRTDHLPTHAGQIAFPGGKVDRTDDGPVATALREAHEEIGLEPEYVTPLGFLDGYRSGIGFHVYPVVALVEPAFRLTLNPAEVADAFEVPLAFLMDAANHQLQEREWKGLRRHFYAMPYGERYIWGATAAILKNMQIRLFGP
jgi:8-oxo-dGTP pyrophosphatase MutT (NUDIX family)